MSAITDFMLPASSPNPFRDIQPYVKSVQVLACPSATVAIAPASPNSVRGDTAYFPNAVTFRSQAISRFTRAAELIMVQEGSERASYLYARPFYESASDKYKRWHYCLGGGGELFSNLHFDGGNFLFVDGHVKWRKYASLSSGEFGLSPNTSWAADGCTSESYYTLGTL